MKISEVKNERLLELFEKYDGEEGGVYRKEILRRMEIKPDVQEALRLLGNALEFIPILPSFAREKVELAKSYLEGKRTFLLDLRADGNQNSILNRFSLP